LVTYVPNNKNIMISDVIAIISFEIETWFYFETETLSKIPRLETSKFVHFAEIFQNVI